MQCGVSEWLFADAIVIVSGVSKTFLSPGRSRCGGDHYDKYNTLTLEQNLQSSSLALRNRHNQRRPPRLSAHAAHDANGSRLTPHTTHTPFFLASAVYGTNEVRNSTK
mgnify:CR=1 FL=1